MVDEVDPRGPRFGQATTAVLALTGAVVQMSVAVYALLALLAVPVLSRWRIDPYRFLWRRVALRVVGPPEQVESAIPHRFARLIGAVLATLAAGLLLVGSVTGVGVLAVGGYAVAAVVGSVAVLSATTGICVGCRMYRQLGLFRDLGLLTSPTPPNS